MEVEGVIAPVVPFSVRPVVEVNVPAEAPAPRVAACAAVCDVQKAVAGP